MSWRQAHGKAARCGRLTVLESPPFDELPAATPSVAGPADRDGAGRFVKGNRLGSAKRFRAGKQGALSKLEKQGDPAARTALAFGRRYAAHRRSELARAHGGELSAGVGAMVESAGELLASARYWSARGIADANPDFARLSATLVAGARQAERDAWELASREAATRPARNRILEAIEASAHAPALPEPEDEDDK